MKLPFIRRKTHDGIVGKLKSDSVNERTLHIRAMKRQEARYEEEIREKIEPMVKKFLNVDFRRTDFDFQKYQLMIQMDTWWVERCLVHGNSQSEISHLCEMIGRQVSYKMDSILRSRNFERTK